MRSTRAWWVKAFLGGAKSYVVGPIAEWSEARALATALRKEPGVRRALCYDEKPSGPIQRRWN